MSSVADAQLEPTTAEKAITAIESARQRPRSISLFIECAHPVDRMPQPPVASLSQSSFVN